MRYYVDVIPCRTNVSLRVGVTHLHAVVVLASGRKNASFRMFFLKMLHYDSSRAWILPPFSAARCMSNCYWGFSSAKCKSARVGAWKVEVGAVRVDALTNIQVVCFGHVPMVHLCRVRSLQE